MASYLVVAHQTCESPELVGHLRQIATNDARAEFVLVVPATQICTLWVCDELESQREAERCAASAVARLRAAGLTVAASHVGDPNPVDAILDELRLRPGYDAVLISTLPPGVSRWLHLDVVSRARRLLPEYRIVHVVAHTVQQPVQAGRVHA